MVLKSLFKICIVNLFLFSTVYPSLSEESRLDKIHRLAEQMAPFSISFVGMPANTSEWEFVDKPFWSSAIAKLGAGKVTVEVRSMSDLNLQGADVFRMVSQNLFDVADISAGYGAGELVELDGLDLAGVSVSFDEARSVTSAYQALLSDALKKRFRTQLLDVSLLTAQTFFCRDKISTIGDLSGRKIRTSTATVADLVGGLGGVPVTMPFAEITQALQRGVIDCVVTGTMSANTAKIYEVANYLFPAVAGWAPRVRIASPNFWSRLDDTQKEWMQEVSDYLTQEVSDPIQRQNSEQGLWCSVGDGRCQFDGQHGVTLAHMTLVDISDQDRETIRQVVQDRVLPAFAEVCGSACAAGWQETVGRLQGLQMPE